MDAMPTLSAPLDHLAGVLAELQAEDLTRLPGPALADRLTGLRQLVDALEAEFTRTVGAFDRSRGYAASGAPAGSSALRPRRRHRLDQR